MATNFLDGIKAGSTSVRMPFQLRKASDNSAMTGFLFSDVTQMSYWREGSVPVSVVPVTLAAATTAWTVGGIKEADATLSPGFGIAHWPDLAFAPAAGVNWVVLSITTGTIGGVATYGWSITIALTSNTEQTADIGVLSPVGFKKNTAFTNFTFPIFNPTDHLTPKTGLTVTATRLIDNGVFGPCANVVTEIGTTGFYRMDFAATDLNGNEVTFNMTAPGGDPLTFSIKTVP